MKCEFCGGDLSLEAEKCPFCGEINKHAQQHIKDMKRYHGEFENTKKGVYSATQKYTEVSVRAIIIAAMVVVIALLIFLYNEAYSIRREIAQMNAKRNIEEYSEILDQYLKEENFREFDRFCEEKEIEGYYPDGEYNEYRPLITSVNYYLLFSEYLMDLVNVPGDRDLEFMCDYLNSFYKYSDIEEYYTYYSSDRHENLEALAVMQKNVEQMLCTYCNLTEEEAASLKELSDAKRTVMIEEKMGNDE